MTLGQPPERVGFDERPVTRKNDQRAGPARKLLARGHYSVPRAALLPLKREAKLGRGVASPELLLDFAADRALDLFGLMAHYYEELFGRARNCRPNHVRYKGEARKLVQHLRAPRSHPGPKPRRHYHNICHNSNRDSTLSLKVARG
jgi:hypothetical protein